MPPRPPCAWRAALAHQVDEHVLQRRLDLGPAIGVAAVGLDRRLERRAVGAADVQRLAERRGHLDARACRQLAAQPVGARPLRLEGDQAAVGDHLVAGAAGDQLAVEDIGDLVAALGLVHVVGRDQHGHALVGEPVDLVPEVAARLRIDAGGRLVEQQQPGLVHHRGGQREALLPAARQLAGQLLAAMRRGPASRAPRRPALRRRSRL